ncbi:MAG: hypothetical protein ABI723_25165 [Bacteroidia bacterium]
MKEKKTQKNINELLDELLDFADDKEKLTFDEMVINTEAMQVVQDLMKSSQQVKTRKELAKRLEVTEAYLSKLFSCDKYFNVPLLAKIQKIFNVRFKVIDGAKLAMQTNVFVLQVPKSHSNKAAKMAISQSFSSNSIGSLNMLSN